MGCAASCLQTTMSLFGKRSDTNSEYNNSRENIERKLYLAKESPEPDFDLSTCDLAKLPSGIFSICKVYRKDRLFLQNNNLKSLQEGGQLADLYLITVLDISCNKFSCVPQDIKYLINLKELYIADNTITYIPDEIQHLQSLQILDVSKNFLTKLTPLLGKLENLRKLNLKDNSRLHELCVELCLLKKLGQIDLDPDLFRYPPSEVVLQGTQEIMKFLCLELNVDYEPPLDTLSKFVEVHSPTSLQNPFAKKGILSWEEQEAAITEQENKIHEAAKKQRAKFLRHLTKEQLELDSEIAKVHEARDVERQNLLQAIKEDELKIVYMVNNFIQSGNLKPEIIQQQLVHEQAEHDKLLEMARQNYDNVKTFDVLNAMKVLIEENYSIQNSKQRYEDSLNDIRQSVLLQELECGDKMMELIAAKEQSRSHLVDQLLEDQEIQKALVASLVERVDARSWSLNQEISLISINLAKLSVIEQEKKKLNVSYNFNELLHQRMQLLDLLNDLLDQKTKRRKQLINTLKEMENEADKNTDFWLKNYQKLIESAPKTLLDVGKILDPVFANYLLQEGVIHCLPFLVKFLFSGESLLNVDLEKLKENGVSLLKDREAIMRAIMHYLGDDNLSIQKTVSLEPTAPSETVVEGQNYTGVIAASAEVSSMESECVVCMDAQCEVVFIPCGHMCCCKKCADQRIELCPMCREDIEKIIKVIVA